MSRKHPIARRTLRAGALALALGVALGACVDTQNLLEVDIPGRVPEEALDNPRLAGTLVNSVIADVECSWDNYVAAASHHSDEWIQSSGNSTMKRWGLRDVPPDFGAYATGGCGASYGLFTPLHGARFQANSNYERIAAFDAAAVPDKTEFLATIRAYGGWPLIAFSEGFCGTPLDGGDAVLEGAELATLAEESFSEAIQLASQVGRDDLVNLARVGRARARLTQENYAGAIEDAEQVPEGFVFVVTRDQTPGDRQNAMYEAINGRAADPASQKHATVAPSYRDVRWKGVVDPRVDVSWDGTSLGFDFTTPHWRHDKANSFNAPTTLASWKEAQLFIAEAAALSGDLPRARQILQMFHDRAGIPAVTEEDIPSRSDVIRHIIEERRRELFAEGGGRLRDHLKWRGTEHEVPFLGEPGSDHPNGVDQYGQPYEDWTCFPVPTVEQG
ncbi:MAG: RagB/SusD family nutrient uptake outer membrane protein [Gemmatimonadetes bacterium]|nr:RagB/SusD family nutrient uptake outer membrane protein [Gemmatimonadota bacterium]